MHGSELVFERTYDLSPAIVWDALVDPELVSGWLAEARIEPRLGGRYDLAWQTGHGLADTTGEIAAMIAPALLRVKTSNIGVVAFRLEGIEGGRRGSSTRLTLTIDAPTERRFSATTYAYWRCNFDQLEDLLRGHPVDWSTWEQDYGAAWTRYLGEASA